MTWSSSVATMPFMRLLQYLLAAPVAMSTASAPDPWEVAGALRERAVQAHARGDVGVAADLMVQAYAAAPEPCSTNGIFLLLQTAEMYISASLSEELAMCRILDFVDDAVASRACESYRPQLLATQQDLEERRVRLGTACHVADPLDRSPARHVPLSVTSDRLGGRGDATLVGVDRQREVTASRRSATGAALLVLALGASVTAITGVILGERIEARARDVAAEDGCSHTFGFTERCAELHSDGLKMNRMAIGGGITAGAALITGVALVVSGALQKARGVSRLRVSGSTLTIRF